MWRKFYSNPGLLLLAILAGGSWYSNLRAIYPGQPANSLDASAALASSPTPTPKFSCKQLYKQRHVKELMDRCSIEERMYVYSLDQSRAPNIISAAGNPTEEERLLRLSPDQYAAETLHSTPAERNALAEFEAANLDRLLYGSAICRDGTYSFSASRRGTCSNHSGVARWLR